MKSKIPTIVVVVAIIGVAVAVFFVLDFSKKNTQLNTDIETLEKDLDETQDQLETSESDLEAMEGEKTTLEEENTQYSNEISDLTTEKEKLTTENEELNDSLEEAQRSIGKLACDFPGFNFSYDSNSSISDNLVEWEKLYDEETEGEWFTFWDNSDDALHEIVIESVSEYFIVFFDDPEFGTTNGIFFINFQCWLDGP